MADCDRHYPRRGDVLISALCGEPGAAPGIITRATITLQRIDAHGIVHFCTIVKTILHRALQP